MHLRDLRYIPSQEHCHAFNTAANTACIQLTLLCCMRSAAISAHLFSYVALVSRPHKALYPVRLSVPCL